jgi:hypothetical protein
MGLLKGKENVMCNSFATPLQVLVIIDNSFFNILMLYIKFMCSKIASIHELSVKVMEAELIIRRDCGAFLTSKEMVTCDSNNSDDEE